MPGIPVAGRETFYHPDAFEHLSTEEELVAEESLSIYCKPVELYNILRRRAIRNPSFLQRCLHYRIKAKHKRRIQMTVSLSRTVADSQTVTPLYICMARLFSDASVSENSGVYRISRIFTFLNSPGIDANTQVQAKFTLPEVNKLAVEARSRSIAILFVSTEENSNSSSRVDAGLEAIDPTSDSRAGEYCLCGKVSLESLYMAWDSSPNFHLGQRAEFMSTVDLLPCILKSDFQNEETSIFINVPFNSENVSTSKKVHVTISAEEFGAKEKSPFHTYAGSEVRATSFSHIIRLREGNVMFNYRYYNNKLQRTEVTEDFSCPFCLIRCACFKGLRYHLSSSHDLFNFEFWVSEECQAVNVSVKTDTWRSEIIGDGVDPKLQTFFLCARPRKRRRPKNLSLKNTKDVIETDFPARDAELLEKDDGFPATIIPSRPDPDCVLSVSEYDIGTPAQLQFAKTRKLSIEHSDPRNCALLRKRQFFHSHRAQPMAIEQVLSDQDSENEVDDDVADLEDRKMLDNFVDVSKDEMQIMHMWNSFVRKQHVLADGHIPWACEAFSKLHAPELIHSPSLACCWRLFMVKLWNHGLLDAKTMNDCNVAIGQYQKPNTDPKS